MRHHIVPDDITWCLQSGDKNRKDEREDDVLDDDYADGDDDEDEEDLDEDDIPPTDPQETMLSLTDLFQSCASTSLSNDFLKGINQEPSTADQEPSTVDEFDTDDYDDFEHDNDCDDFEKLNFNASLYTIAKNSQWTRYNALENTEYTIHRNMKKSLGPIKKVFFKVGQKVLFKNPDLTYKTFQSFSFNQLNLIGIVKECCGENYILEVKDGTDKAVKFVFKGELVPLTDGDEINEDEEEPIEMTCTVKNFFENI